MATGESHVFVTMTEVPKQRWENVFGKGRVRERGVFRQGRDGHLVKVADSPSGLLLDNKGRVPIDYDPTNPKPFHDASLGMNFNSVQERQEYMDKNGYFFGE